MRKQVWDYLTRSWDNAEKERQRNEQASLALFETIARNEWLLVSQLLEEGCSPNMRLGKKTTLMHAAECGSIECLKLLCSLGADMGAQDEIGRDILHCAVESGLNTAVDAVLAKQPKNKRLFSDNATALIVATKLSYVHAVRQIVTFMPHLINMYDRTGRTALWHVLSKSDPTDDDNEIARILLDSGANPDIADIDGIAPREAALNPSTLAEIERHDIDTSVDLSNDNPEPQAPPPAPKNGMRL